MAVLRVSQQPLQACSAILDQNLALRSPISLPSGLILHAKPLPRPLRGTSTFIQRELIEDPATPERKYRHGAHSDILETESHRVPLKGNDLRDYGPLLKDFRGKSSDTILRYA